MDFSWTLAIVGPIALVAIGLNVVATLGVMRARTLERFQKVAQALIVWLVPALGALLVLHLLRDAEPEALPRRVLGSRGLAWYVYAGDRRDAPAEADGSTTCIRPDAGDPGSGGHGGGDGH